MIDREKVTELVKRNIKGTNLFIVDIHVSRSNDIRILVDNQAGVNIRECVELSRAIESSLSRDEQDFNLEVSSPGLFEPFKVLPQYKKNIGREVEVITTEGLKHEGKLIRMTDNGIIIEKTEINSRKKKRAEIKAVEKEFGFDRIRSTKVLLPYK